MMGGPRVSQQDEDKRVLILMMPFATPEFPGLGPTLIRSILLDAGLPTDIVYANLTFSRLVGGDPFAERILAELPICELAFTPYYFDTPAELASRQLRDYVLEIAQHPAAHSPERFDDLVRDAGRCIDELEQGIEWERYDIVGFSLLMGQTVASLALAKRIKARHPEITIVFGGANTQEPMGREMLRSFAEVDYVLEGEADELVVPFVQALRSGRRRSFDTGGVLFRDAGGGVTSSGEATPFQDLDSLPVPDFSEFFRQLEENELQHIQPYMSFETSRGCWWGAKHHCTFCGIDDRILTFRSKSAPRVLDEVLTLSARHQYTEFFAVDSIINFKFSRDLLPALGDVREQQEWDFTFFFESKSNLGRDLARRFRHGGVNHVQPGLESFSDHVLELMDKGTTGARQVQCLKVLHEQGIAVDWNLIFGNPGETCEDYRETLDAIRSIHHLRPLAGRGWIPMQINRFAPNFNEPERHGVREIRPRRYYPLIYPDESVDLDRLAFYFDCDWADPPSQELLDIQAEVEAALENWRACYVEDALFERWGPGFVEIVDRRSWDPDRPVAAGEERVYLLEGVEADVYAFCAEVRSSGALEQAFADRLDGEELAAFLDELVERRLLYRSPSGQLVSLPLRREAEEALRSLPDDDRERGEGSSAAAPQLAVGVGGAAAVRSAGGGALLESRLAVRAPGLPRSFEVDDRDSGEQIEELLALVAEERTLQLRLHGEALGVEAPIWDALADARGAGCYGIEISCELDDVPLGRRARRLREAGLCSVALGDRFAHHEGDAVLTNLWRLAAVKSLSAAGIRVEWQLDERPWREGQDLQSMIDVLAAVAHLPPPTAEPETAAARAALARWRAAHRERTLTYARGPGFMRIFDRREGEHAWRFISLDDRQAAVLAACETPVQPASIGAGPNAVDAAALGSFLDAMISEKVACRGPAGEVVALPIRRSIEERWASGDY